MIANARRQTVGRWVVATIAASGALVVEANRATYPAAATAIVQSADLATAKSINSKVLDLDRQQKDAGTHPLATWQLAQAPQSGAERLHQVGDQQAQNEQWQAALKTYQQALELHRAQTDRLGEGIALWKLGKVHQALEQYAQAVEFLKSALEIARELDNRIDEATTLNDLAVLYREQGLYSNAETLYQQALAIRREQLVLCQG